MPASAVRPRLYPSCAPKFWFTVCATRSLLISSNAETNGSFTASSAASISACAASFKILRIATRETCAIAADATPDNPNVTTAVAAATAIWIASTIS
ncbi:hypothetical protein [Streptomyces sp. NPDC102360]|uniref:hypothetical protein n=1 Tax=Streptomyces sp. NPDC102360 TaxID=3366160 RepID=UPI00380DD515